MMRWLVREWPYAALFTAVFLLLLLPFFDAFGLAITLVYLQIPLYMLHQFEEHDQDRFRIFANEVVGKGREAFTPLAIFTINSLGVWMVDLIALYLAVFVDLKWSLMAIYLPLFNAATHIVASLALRRYNPGLWTGLFLFLPVGVWSLLVVTRTCHADWPMQMFGFGIALLVHALIMIYVKLRLRRLA